MYIEFRNVCKNFKKEEVLKDISFGLEQSKIYGFVGRNGSGKTVIFKMITGLLLPTSGEIFVNGVNIAKSKKFSSDIGVLIETPGFIGHYTGLKNLQILNDMSQKKVSTDTIKSVIKLVGLDPDSKKKVKTYSLGMKQKLGIAQSIMNKPNLLVLDEPMNGLDEASVEKMRDFFINLKNEGTTILLASHNQQDIEVLCDQIFYIKDGKVQN
ncbi:MAG: multidrug ABC transporter ATP-binding protein [Epulopiscium sp. Nele67-Bin004]|nr:MAG: multidrug ABC transporter ATP-binding protein [Epulopiscium sp. Nele67-Bin004]